MPTITTTVTSAAASGVVTTQTTTEATPETGAAANAASDMIKEMIGSWASGELLNTYKKYWSPSVKINAGPGNTGPWGSHTFATFASWIEELSDFEFHDMNWIFYPRPGGAVGEWTVSGLTQKSTGKKCGAFTACNLFDVTDGMITNLVMLIDYLSLERAFSDDRAIGEKMIAAWASDDRATMKSCFTDDFVFEAMATSAPGWGTHTMADFDAWTETLATTYDFKDMEWTFDAFDRGCIGEWKVSSMVRKDTGKGTGPMVGVNQFFVTDGKISRVVIHNNTLHELDGLFATTL